MSPTEIFIHTLKVIIDEFEVGSDDFNEAIEYAVEDFEDVIRDESHEEGYREGFGDASEIPEVW